MRHPLRRFASPPFRGATPVARPEPDESRSHGVCWICTSACPNLFSLEN